MQAEKVDGKGKGQKKQAKRETSNFAIYKTRAHYK